MSRLGGETLVGRISEVEAYLGFDDPAAHAYLGRRNAVNASLYLGPGFWYVYRSYGIHWCANLVAGPKGTGAAVLIRGAVIEQGIELARRRRGTVTDRSLSNGPGKLCQAFGIDRSLDGARMRGSPVEVRAGRAPSAIEITPRIGITRAADWPLRFLSPPEKR